MENKFDFIFENYVKRVESPDGRDTYESLPQLNQKIIDHAAVCASDTIIDIGCGWGNVTIQLSGFAKRIIGIEPNAKNLEEAKERAKMASKENIEWIKGSFEKPNYTALADKIISSLVFHQVENKEEALLSMKKLLKKDGIFVLCDTLILFNPMEERILFNEVYRFLIEKTTPRDIYKKYIKPHFEDTRHIYSWDDMKKYTPKNNQFYCLNDLKELLKPVNMEIINVDKIAPFFGIITIKNR